MTKQEKIQEAYGEHWEPVKDFVCENGWCDRKGSQFSPSLEKFELSLFGELVRPKSLQGIETNNGWIKIESEDDLPKESIDCHYRLFVSETYSNAGEYILSGRFRVKSSLTNSTNFFTCDDMIRSFFPRVTHYQPTQKPQPPIY